MHLNANTMNFASDVPFKRMLIVFLWKINLKLNPLHSEPSWLCNNFRYWSHSCPLKPIMLKGYWHEAVLNVCCCVIFSEWSMFQCCMVIPVYWPMLWILCVPGMALLFLPEPITLRLTSTSCLSSWHVSPSLHVLSVRLSTAYRYAEFSFASIYCSASS